MVPGPTGAAPLSTESLGDPDAGDPTSAVEGGAAAGALVGAAIGGPVGLAAGAAIGAAAGGLTSPARDDETVDDAGGRRPAPSTDELHRGRRAPGPLGAHEDVPVIDALTEQTGPDRT